MNTLEENLRNEVTDLQTKIYEEITRELMTGFDKNGSASSLDADQRTVLSDEIAAISNYSIRRSFDEGLAIKAQLEAFYSKATTLLSATVTEKSREQLVAEELEAAKETTADFNFDWSEQAPEEYDTMLDKAAAHFEAKRLREASECFRGTTHGTVYVYTRRYEDGGATIFTVREDGTGYAQDISDGQQGEIYDLPPELSYAAFSA